MLVICENCGKQHNGNFGSGRFCSRSCANSFSSKQLDNNKTKKIKCLKCDKIFLIKIRSSSKNFYCAKCKKSLQKSICNICGQQEHPRPDICKRYTIIPTLIKYFNFDTTKLKSIKVYDEFDRIKNEIIELYYFKNKSLLDLIEIYNHNNVRNFSKILDSFGIKRRSLSKAQQIAVIEGKHNLNKVRNNKHKHGWHISWNNKKVFYRSSIELKYAKELDKSKIDYDMEKIKIPYWDSQEQKIRIAIPDFYISSTNMLVEIKSNYFYNEANMEDKIKEYIKQGFNVDLKFY